MKKLLAFGCFVLAFQSLSQVASGTDALELQNGRKTLVRALAVIVNSDAHRKVPPKRLHIPNLESPRV